MIPVPAGVRIYLAMGAIPTIRWRGGQHSQLRLTKPQSGEHGCRTPDEAAIAVIRSMAARWLDGVSSGCG